MPRKEKPFIGFGEAHSWQGLAGALDAIGIHATADALQALRRRHKLPWVQGGGQRGRAVWFGQTDIENWARWLTGASTAAMTRAMLRRAHTGQSTRWKRKRRKVRSREAQLLCRPLYVVLVPGPQGSVDYVLRDMEGGLYATDNWFEAESWTPRGGVIWHYRRSAFATEADRTPSAAPYRAPPDPAARSLIGAVQRRGRTFRWCEVPLRCFKGPVASADARTPFLCPKRHRGYKAAHDWLVEHEPDATMVKWWDRVRVIPGTLESARQYAEPNW